MSLFLERTSSGRKPAVVMIGRFNPPTAGHYFVMDTMKKYIRENTLGVKSAIVVIVDGEGTGKDKQKNPLTGAEREAFIKASGKANGIHILSAPNGFEAFSKCRDAGFEPVAVAAGSDRADHYLDLLDKYFDKDPNGQKITHEKVPGLDRDMSTTVPEGEIDVKAISGSMARHAAELGYEDEFIKIVGLEDKPALGKKLFNRVVNAMKSHKPEEETA